jgi:hypothetical protein
MSSPQQLKKRFRTTHFNMVWHLLFLWNRCFIFPLELIALIDPKSINPGNRFIANEAEISLPPDQVISVLNYERALLRRVIVLTVQEIIPKE